MSKLQRVAVYPGTFDPITNGHIDILQRALPLFDKIYMTIAVNSDKKPLFTVAERIEMVETVTAGIEEVEVMQFSGLIVDFARKVGARAIIRGLRAVSDFEYEFQIALMNRKLWHKVDTVYLMPGEKYTYLSSSIIREVARHGGNVECFVPAFVEARLKAKLTGGGK